MRIALTCLAVGLIFLAGCSTLPPEPVVARVGSETVTLRQYNKILKSAAGANGGEILKTEAGRKQLLEDIIRGKLVLAAARQEGIHNRPEVQRRIAALRAELDDYFEMQSGEIIGHELVSQQMRLADREAEAYYETHKAELEKPVELKARQMLLGSKAQAEQMLERLRQGEDFAALAQQFSQDKVSAPRGGEMECFGRGQCPFGRQVEEAAFSLETPGQVSAPVATPAGYRVLQLVAKRPAQAVSQDETMFRIRTMLKTEKYDEIVQELAKRIKVQIDGQVLSKAAITRDKPAGNGVEAAASVRRLE